MVTAKKAAASKAGATKPVARKGGAAQKDPQGGLTAAGRAAFAEKDGAQLKPGVKRGEAEMSPDDMKRKGSWAVRFYGRASLPPLVDAKGRPTRFALSAHAWGEPVPKTEAEARRIAEAGRRLLDRYAAAKETPAKKTAAKKAPGKTATAGKATARKAAVKTAVRPPE